MNATAGRSLGLPGLRLVDLDGVSVPAAARRLESEAGVRYAEPNYRGGWEMIPDDDYFVSQWALSNTGQGIDTPPVFGTPGADIDAPAAWSTSTGSAATIVGIADTGTFYNHPDLAGNIYLNPGESGGKAANGIDDDANGYIDDFRGYDFFGDDNDAAPKQPPLANDRHGTLVASVAGAQGNNSIGISGVSQEVSLLPLRVGDGAAGPLSANQVLAYRYAGGLGAEVVNLSGGGTSFSQAVLDSIRAAPNTLFVFAAGNGGADKLGDDNDATPQYPCNLDEPNVVCVAATDQDDQLASFSNYGAASVDLAAPGVNILATTIGTDPANSYDFVDGTSFAAPTVAGAAALYRSHHPGATALDTANALRAGVDKLASLSGVVATGGRLDLERTLTVPPDTSIAVALEAKRRQKVRGLRVELGCGDEACEGELSGEAVARRGSAGRRAARAAGPPSPSPGKRSFAVRTQSVSLAPGEREVERIRFERHANSVKRLRALLADRGRVKAKLEFSATDLNANSATERVRVKLRR